MIKNLEIYAYHGAYQEENVLGQKFILSLSLSVDLQKAGRNDALTDSVHYGEVCKLIEKTFLQKQFRLLEACAENLAETILNAFPSIKEVELSIKKPWAPIGSHLEYAGISITRGRHTVYLGLGSNLGDRREYLQKAVKLLTEHGIHIKQVSGFYETKPVGYLEQGNFLNCAAEAETLFSPNEVLHICQKIETELKRERTIHWGPRTIDIDILFFDELVTSQKNLILPHPRITERLFVLVPLAEISPYFLHPLERKRIFQLKEELERTQSL